MSNHKHPFYCYGASGHAKVIADMIEGSSEYELKGYFDDNEQKWHQDFVGLPVLGGFSAAKDMTTIIAIGDNEARLKLSHQLSNQGVQFITLIAPSAVVSKSAEVGLGTCVMPNAVINADAKIGEHVIVNTSAVIEHDAVIEAGVHIAPNVTLCGGVKVGEGALIGAGSVILPGIEIGSGAVVGAGSVITKKISAGARAVGAPAKELGL